MRSLALIGVIAVLLLGWPCVADAQQTVHPPGHKVAKAGGDQNGISQPRPDSGKQATPNQQPILPQGTTTDCNEACQQGKANLAIQSKLVSVTGGLVIVGVLQVLVMILQAIFLWKTRVDVHTQAEWMKTQAGHMGSQLAEMKRQTMASVISAKAARRQTNVAMNAQRAWVSVSLTQPPIAEMKNITDRPNAWFTGIGVHLKTIGQTPARVRRSKILVAFVDTIEDGTQLIKPSLPDDPIYGIGIEMVQEDTVWMPGDNYGYFVHLPRRFFPQIPLEFEIGLKALCLYGFVEYLDAFEIGIHTTRFCYVYQPFPPGSDLKDAKGQPLFSPEFRIGGPAAYNQTT